MSAPRLASPPRLAPPWWRRRFLGLDLETTDKAPKVARIVSAALTVVDDAGEVEGSYYALVQQDGPIPEEATGIHGITDADCAARGVQLEHVLRDIANAMDWAIARGVPVVMFNAKYDWTVVNTEAGRFERPILILPVLILDPRIIDLHCDQYRKGARRLADVAGRYLFERAGKTAAHLGWHDARRDALLAVLTARQQLVQFAHLKSFTLEELHAEQAKWFAAWRDHINEHWKSKGLDKHEDGEWPR